MNAIAQRENGGAVQRMNENPYDHLRFQLSKRADEFKMALPAHITPEKFQRTIMTAAQSNPDILKADRATLITSCMKSAQDGLLPDGREAALVTFNTRVKDAQGKWTSVKQVQYMPMVYGLRKKILQSGEVADIQTAVVYRQEIEAGLFIYEEGTERMLRHKPNLDPTFDPSDDDIAAAYSVATLKDGTKTFEVMPRRDINKVRQASQTGALGKTDRQGNPIPPKGPWVDWFSEMARKTVMRRHSKTLPMSGDIIDMEAVDEALAARSATLAMAIEPDAPTALAPPTRDESGENFDPVTGEIIDQGGDDEETARELDAKTEGWQEGAADEQRGEANAVTLESAKAQIDACELVADVNAKANALLGELGEEDADLLRTHAMDRIETLKAPKK
ncbi:recombinase RecT [Sphingobium indicum]|uniref:Rect protein n=1 Tax=Sphingobium indicum (strain DSM 16412 / CCM 7286 / MTCC 6364 / B90A) TaxID=861109 RepID=A0A1L5BMW9_SPHIB|nr:recombinase RecT [Sphingobium indicum]APL94117.1 hypothetical protein SIDU_06125 [Sphingobium indicum B90A]